MGNFDELTSEEREQVKKLRDRGFRSLKKICLIQLGLATISVLMGIVLVAMAAGNPKFPYIVAAPIWSGILVAIGAICGFQAARHGTNKDDVEDKVKGYVICHYVFNVLCTTLCLGSGVLSVIGVIFCQSTDQRVSVNCEVNHTALLALSIATIVISLFLAIFCILGTCYFCFYGRTLGFKGRRNQRYDRRIQRMQNEINQLRAAQGLPAQPPPEDEGQGRFNYGVKVTMVDLSR